MRQPCDKLLGELRLKTSESAFFVGHGAPDDRRHFSFVERIQDQHTAARQQGADYFERRIFSRSANQRDGSILDRWQQSVLLCFVEAMNFVDEEDRAAP